MVSHLYEKFDSRVRQLIKYISCRHILRVVIVVINYVSQMNHAFDIKFVGRVDQAVDGRVHYVPAVFHCVLCIRNQDDIVVVLIFQRIILVASVLAEILLRIFNEPLASVQASFGYPYFLQASLEEFIQRLSAFLPPAGADAEASVFRIRVHAGHLVRHIIPERLASVYICADLMPVGSHGDMIPHAAFIHCYGPRGI